MTYQILVVDDEPDMQSLIRQKLRRQIRDKEFEFFFSHNGEHALQTLAEQPGIDLVMTDINMPVMDGLEFVRQLQTIDKLRGVPVVMITTEGSESNVVQALSFGAKGYIRKPFTPDQVKERVLPVMGLRQ